MASKSKVNKWDMKVSNGNWLTNGLFFETDSRVPKQAVYTLKDEDHVVKGKTFVSLRALYLQYDHTPGAEYEFANDHLGGWDHWKKLCESPELKSHIEDWREELEVKIRANSIKGVIQQSRTEKGFQAGKWLAEGGYSPKKRGRPSKEEVARERRIQAGIEDNLTEIYDRVKVQ